jgi:hypothetical protein
MTRIKMVLRLTINFAQRHVAAGSVLKCQPVAVGELLNYTYQLN